MGKTIIGAAGALFAAAPLAGASNAEAAAFTVTHILDDPTPTSGDRFGRVVAIDGTRALVGASSDSTNGPLVGQAHLFDTTTGVLLQTFDDPTVTQFDRFGSAVAIEGDLVLIGAPGDDTAGDGLGQAHLFDANTGQLLRTFDEPNPTQTDGFGSAVGIDGGRVVIGASGDDSTALNVGQAYLFNADTGALLQTFDDPTPSPIMIPGPVPGLGSSDQFGSAVTIDGDLVLIGAPFDNTVGEGVGQAHLFDANTGQLLQTFDDPTPTSSDFFGRSLALDGTHVLIGAPNDDTDDINSGQAHLFDASTGAFLRTFSDPRPTESNRFGISVALDGDRVVIGASGDNRNGNVSGQAYRFDASTGELLQTLLDPTPAPQSGFGSGVAIDGDVILIGASLDDSNGRDVGQAFLFPVASGTSAFVPVPVPATLALVAAGLIGLTVIRRRRPQ